MRTSTPGTERLTLAHVRAVWRCSHTRHRFSPLRLWRAISLLFFTQVDKPAPEPHWEAVPDEPHPDDEKGGRFWRVRWSEPDAGGRYLYVRHYGGNGSSWNQNAAERNAREFNEKGRRPFEYSR